MFILPLGLLAKIRKIVQIIKVQLEVLKEVPLLLVLVAQEEVEEQEELELQEEVQELQQALQVA